jgi:hypothetical protein
MVNLENIFRNYFINLKIGDDRFQKFTADHLVRISTGMDADALRTLVAPSTEAYEAYLETLSEKDSHIALQKGKTVSADGLITTFKAKVRQHEGLIRSKFEMGTPVYLEFFPKKLTEYTTANKKNVDLLMKRFASGTAKYKAELGEDLANLFAGLLSDYKASRKEQLGKKSDLSDAKLVQADSRLALEEQLMKNIFYIGYLFGPNVDKCLSFFDQSIIRSFADSDHDGFGQLQGTITSDGIVLVGVSVEFTNRKVALCHSSSDGKYRSRYLETGIVKVRFSKEGYKSQERDIEIKDEGFTSLDMELQRLS